MVRCNRCGKENPESLRFCQDCGNRLISGEVAGVAPTPPRGLTPVAQPSAPPAATPSVVPPFFSPPATFAPAAPVSSGARVSEAPMRPAAPQFEFSAQRPAERRCTRCGTSNPASGRFCSNCGGSLERASEPSTAPQAPQAASRSVPPPAPPVPQVAAAPSPPATHPCPRCRGPRRAYQEFHLVPL